MPHLMKLFIDRLVVIGACLASPIFICAFLEPYNLWPALTSGSPEPCIRKASSQLCSKLCHNFHHLVTIAAFYHSHHLFRGVALEQSVESEIHCDQSDTFNVSRAMNHLSLALGHKPSQFPEPMAQWAIGQRSSWCSEDARVVSAGSSRSWAALRDSSTFSFSLSPHHPQSSLSRSYPALDQM